MNKRYGETPGTTHVRIYKDLALTLKHKFPEVNMQDLVQIMWDTSLLKVEGSLRKEVIEKTNGHQ